MTESDIAASGPVADLLLDVLSGAEDRIAASALAIALGVVAHRSGLSAQETEGMIRSARSCCEDFDRTEVS